MPTSKRIKDLLPEEVKKRDKVIKKIIKVFEKYNYQQIVTPAFEDYDLLKKGLPNGLDENSFKFFDHGGKMQILRPDITTQIARVVGTTMSDTQGPIKLCYAGDVYRAKNLAIGQEKQFTQVGIELFDMPESKADKEILQVVEEVLTELGLKNYEIAKTNVTAIKKLSKDEKKAIDKQDFVALGRLPKKEELMTVDIDYYTGLYFECYVPEVGYVLGSGGRYDNLVEVFGDKKNSVGFAFDLHHLMVAMSMQKLI